MTNIFLSFFFFLINWIESCLRRRSSQVSVNGSLSQAAETESGAPQGSVLGPILFVIYVNDSVIQNQFTHIGLVISKNILSDQGYYKNDIWDFKHPPPPQLLKIKLHVRVTEHGGTSSGRN